VLPECIALREVDVSNNAIGEKMVNALQALESKNFKLICDGDEEVDIEFN
jgi:predicted nuclease of predicted toxin-antitoxin system